MRVSKSLMNERHVCSRRPPLQREVLRDVMLSASACDTWLTLEELSRMTSYPPASVSAHLRHLRKLQHGGYRVEKRCRASVKLFSPVEEPSATGPVWEYRLERKRASGTENSGSVRDAKPGEAQLASRQGSEFSRYGYRSRNGFSSGGER